MEKLWIITGGLVLSIALIVAFICLATLKGKRGVNRSGDPIRYALSPKLQKLRKIGMSVTALLLVASVATTAVSASGGLSDFASLFVSAKEGDADESGSPSGVIGNLADILKTAATASVANLQEETQGETKDSENTTDSIPDVVTNLTLMELEARFDDIPQDYLRMCDASMANARVNFTGIGDAFAIPLYAEQAWFDAGTFWEKNDADLSELDYGNLLTDADPKRLEELKKERLAEIAKMTEAEQNAFYQRQIYVRMVGSPQYQLAFATLAKESPLITENNMLLLEKYFRFVARCNEVKLESFSEEFQKNFADADVFDEFLEEVMREPTEEEIKAGRKTYKDIEDDLLDQFLNELAKMPLGIDKCLQYDSEHPNDIRYLQITDEVQEFGWYFCAIMDYMPNYGMYTMTTIKNWTSPVLRADDRILAVVEADYQENVPDENGKIQHPHRGFWKWFPLKDSGQTNRIFAGVNEDDGRWMLAEPTTKPVDKPKDPTPNLTVRYLEEKTNKQLANPKTEYRAPNTSLDDVKPVSITGYTCINPDECKGKVMPDGSLVVTFYYRKAQTTKTPTYLLTVVCKDEASGQQFDSFTLGRHEAGEVVEIPHRSYDGREFIDGPSVHTMPAHDDTVTLIYRQKPSGGDPDPDDPNPSPKPDGDGGKTPTAGSSQNGEGDKGGGDNGANNGGHDDGSYDDYDKEKAEADRIAQEAAEAEKRRQEEEERKRKEEEERKRQEEEAAKREQENAQNQGQGSGITTEGGTEPEKPKEEIPAPDTEWTEKSQNPDGSTTSTTTNAATGAQTTEATIPDGDGNFSTETTEGHKDPDEDTSDSIEEPPADDD